MLRFCDTLVTAKSPVRQVPGCGSTIVERFLRETVLGGFVHEKIDKASPHGGRIVCVCYRGGVLALARDNVKCPKCGSAAYPEVIQGTTATQHTIQYVCSNSGCEHFYSYNGWTETSAHTFVGDSCEKTCSECLYTAMVHTRGDRQNVQAATCGKEGYTGDVYCTKCDTLIEKGYFTPATGNHSYALKNNKAATCTEDGYTGDMICTVCGDVKSHGEVIPATGKHNYELRNQKAATCLREGYTGDQVCSVCRDKIPGKVIEATGHKYVLQDDAKPATCTEAGHTASKICSVCKDKVNGDVLPATGHDCEIKEGSWVWTTDSNGKPTAASAIVTCKNCDFSTPAEVSIQSTDYRLPDCTTSSSQNYVATATYNGKKVGTDTRTVPIPATGHNYGENPKPVMAWDVSGANPTATATFTCETCKEPQVVNIASSDIGHVYQTSCTDEDHTVYTATFSFQGKKYEETYTVPHPGTTPGHAYIGKWTWAEDPADGATLTLTCSKCANVETFPVSATKQVTTPATCTTAGKEVYSVSYTYTNPYTNAATPYSDSKTVTLDPLGHDHTGTVTVAFDDDTCQTATAAISCIRCSDTVTAPAVVTSEVTKPATCTAPGETTYTAAYGDVSTSKTVANIPALGHHFTNTRYNGDSSCEGEGTQTSVCDRCGATDTQTVPGSAGCTLHKVETAQVCPICGKVNGAAALNAVSAAADTSASTYGYRLVVRAGTLPNGRKVLTVAFLNAEGQAISLNGTQKIRISLAELNAQLGEDGAQGFAHTLTDLNTANGATGSVGFAVENGTLILDAAFHNSTASVLLVD